MVPQITLNEILLWLSLLTILNALVGMILLPQNGPIKIALNRSRLVLFVEISGLFFALIYATSLLGYIH